MLRVRLLFIPVCLCLSAALATAFEDVTLPFARVFASVNGRYGLRLVVDRDLTVRATLFQPHASGSEQVVWERLLDYVPDRVLVSDRGDVVGVDQMIVSGRWNTLVIFDRAGSILAAYDLDDFLSEEEIEDKVPLRDGGRRWRKRASFAFDYEAERGGSDYILVSFDWGRRIAFDLRTGHVLDEEALHPQTACGWPRRLAGRELQFITERYVLYGTDHESAKAMRDWVEAELTSFERHYTMPAGRGLVLMLDADQAPLPEIEGWRSETPDRPRVIDWSSNDRRQATVHSRNGRPYCLLLKPYFHESFALIRPASAQTGDVDESMPKPAWVCALSTDAQVKAAFNEEARQHERQALEKGKEEMKDMPADQRLANWMFYGMYKSFVPVWRSIDVKLMRLQRREALWQALIRNSGMPEEQQTKVLSSLRDEIDEAWKELYFSRPYD
jgi:hypothetical protein